MKKTLCLLLCLSLLMTAVSVPCLAAGAPDAPDAPVYPFVLVRGMDLTDGLSEYPFTEDEVPVTLAIDAGEIVKTLFKALGAALTKGGKDAAVDVILDYAYNLLKEYSCDANGDSLNKNVGNNRFYPESMAHYPEMFSASGSHEGGILNSAISRYGADNVYYYVYDWRLDAGYNADGLAALIDTALADHGTDKVNIMCCSMGGIVTLSYLTYYGSEHVNCLVSNSSTMYGTDVATDLFGGKVDFDEDAAVRFLSSKAPGLAGFFKILKMTGIVKLLCNFINNFYADYREEIFDRVLRPVFGTMPQFWDIVQPEKYEECKANIFGDDTAAYAGLIAKTDKIQREVVSKRCETINAAMANGMKFAVIANYNTPNICAYESAGMQGDGTLETRTMSFGALVSDVGGVLTEEALNTGDKKYVSPDQCINASTAAFRDETWFVKDAGHIGGIYGSEYSEFLFRLLDADTQPTVDTFEGYMQFMQTDAAENLSPVTGQTVLPGNVFC